MVAVAVTTVTTGSASLAILLRRTKYGGRKGRSAEKRLKRGVLFTHPSGGSVLIRGLEAKKAVRRTRAHLMDAEPDARSLGVRFVKADENGAEYLIMRTTHELII